MVENFFTALSHGNVEGAIQASRKSKYFLIRALNYALTHKEKSLSSALLYAQEREMKRYRRGIPILDTVITLAPLLGLLGTVTGMMGSFSLIGGDLGAPGAITGGIAEALIATAFGLGIAITSLIPFNFLNNKMEEARIEIETAATQLELLVHPTEIIKTEPMQDWFNESQQEVPSMHSSSGGNKKRARIEIIPLIDIIFFLLATFIMVSLSMSKNQGVQVALPAASSASSITDQQDQDKAVTLSVNEKGDVFFNKEKITVAQLPLKLQIFKTASKDPKVIINSDASADFKYVVSVLDEVRKIGINKVGINTDKK